MKWVKQGFKIVSFVIRLQLRKQTLDILFENSGIFHKRVRIDIIGRPKVFLLKATNLFSMRFLQFNKSIIFLSQLNEPVLVLLKVLTRNSGFSFTIGANSIEILSLSLKQTVSSIILNCISRLGRSEMLRKGFLILVEN